MGANAVREGAVTRRVVTALLSLLGIEGRQRLVIHDQSLNQVPRTSFHLEPKRRPMT